jgi:hypothetical protein
MSFKIGACKDKQKGGSFGIIIGLCTCMLGRMEVIASMKKKAKPQNCKTKAKITMKVTKTIIALIKGQVPLNIKMITLTNDEWEEEQPKRKEKTHLQRQM